MKAITNPALLQWILGRQYPVTASTILHFPSLHFTSLFSPPLCVHGRVRKPVRERASQNTRTHVLSRSRTQVPLDAHMLPRIVSAYMRVRAHTYTHAVTFSLACSLTHTKYAHTHIHTQVIGTDFYFMALRDEHKLRVCAPPPSPPPVSLSLRTCVSPCADV